MQKTKDNTFRGGLVRRLDPDRYLCALFAPKDRRADLLALYAFHLEVARIPELVREPILGRVRLQWWRETLDAVFAGSPPAHEVAAALARAVQSRGLGRGEFERMLAAREFDLEPDPPEDMAALEAYVDATSGALQSLALDVLAPGAPPPVRESVRDVAMAWGLTGLIRAVPFHARMGRVYLPKSLLARESLSAADVRAGRAAPGLKAVVRDVAARARELLTAGRRRPAPEAARAVLLPAVLAESDLGRIARAGFDPFDPRIEGGRIPRFLRLWRAALRSPPA